MRRERTCPRCSVKWEPKPDADPARGRYILRLCPTCFADTQYPEQADPDAHIAQMEREEAERLDGIEHERELRQATEDGLDPEVWASEDLPARLMARIRLEEAATQAMVDAGKTHA